jgi:hypothetical protein
MAIGDDVLSVHPAIIGNAQKVVSLTLGSGRTSMPHKDPERRAEYARRYREANRETASAYQREYRRTIPKDRKAEYERRYFEADPEGYREKKRQSRRRYVEGNREMVNETSRERQRRAREADPDLVWRRGLWQRHGLTPERWQQLIDDQSGRCCYCERPLPTDRTKIHVDHDHSCTCGPDRSCDACRRGISCHECNAAIGYGGDDADRMERIAANLRRLKAEAVGRINTKPVQAELFVINEAASRRKEVG